MERKRPAIRVDVLVERESRGVDVVCSGDCYGVLIGGEIEVGWAKRPG